jgi:hypothetical protein
MGLLFRVTYERERKRKREREGERGRERERERERDNFGRRAATRIILAAKSATP